MSLVQLGRTVFFFQLLCDYFQIHIFCSKTLQQFLLSNKEAILGASRYQRGRSKVGFNLRSKPQMAALRKPMTRFGGIFFQKTHVSVVSDSKWENMLPFIWQFPLPWLPGYLKLSRKCISSIFHEHAHIFHLYLCKYKSTCLQCQKFLLFLPRGTRARLVSVNQYPVKWLWTDQRL